MFKSEFDRCCTYAMVGIDNGNYAAAIEELRRALKVCPHPRAWSKIMLAIRELSRVA